MKDLAFHFSLENPKPIIDESDCIQKQELQIIKLVKKYILEIISYDHQLYNSIKNFFDEYITSLNKNSYVDLINIQYIDSTDYTFDLTSEFLVYVDVDKQKNYFDLKVSVIGTDNDNSCRLSLPYNENLNFSFQYLQNYLENFIIKKLNTFNYNFNDALWTFNFKNF